MIQRLYTIVCYRYKLISIVIRNISLLQLVFLFFVCLIFAHDRTLKERRHGKSLEIITCVDGWVYKDFYDS